MKNLLLILFVAAVVIGCGDNSSNGEVVPEHIFKLQYAEEDAQSLAIIVSTRAKNHNEVSSVLKRNNIDFEYEIIQGVKYPPSSTQQLQNSILKRW